jgi:peroxiredoxin
VVIFYLGAGCMHCVEQLRKFTPLARDFEAAGITLLAASTEDPEALRRSSVEFAKDGGIIAFPLLTDPGLATFKAYRAYDDFEGQPMHGTFLIDGDGLVRWQDIGAEPYADPKFLLTEAKRLLSLPVGK